MDNSTIGIKIADGTYFPILDGEDRTKKRLVLTTVNDNQESVQIDLYKGSGEEIRDALYIGSLVIEGIETAAKGEPEIELVVGVDAGGNLNATAGDTVTGEKQSLSISLESLEDGVFSTPNFELDEESFFEDIPDFTSDEDESFGEDPDSSGFDSFEEDQDLEEPEEEYVRSEGPARSSRRGFPALAVIVLLVILIIAAGAFLFLRGSGKEQVPALEADGSGGAGSAVEQEQEAGQELRTEPGITIEPEAAAEPETVAEKAPEKISPAGPAVAPSVETPVPSVRVPGSVPPVGKGGGVWYRLKWGDNLWNLSLSFYRTPWLYGNIADANRIKNPDLIYAGTDIFIPEN